ncbi:MAG: response regulator transcription factor [Sphingomonadales bacterium]
MQLESDPIVYIVDDDDGVRRTLGYLFETMGLETRGFASARDFLREFSADRPGCVILDMIMDGMTGLALLKELATLADTLPVIMITGHGDVSSAVAAMRHGAIDFIEKPYRNKVMIDSVREAIAKSAQAHRLREKISREERALSKLTPREREVFDLVVQGQTNKMIGQKLGISPRTVEIHRGKVMQKTGAASVAKLVRLDRGHTT